MIELCKDFEYNIVWLKINDTDVLYDKENKKVILDIPIHDKCIQLNSLIYFIKCDKEKEFITIYDLKLKKIVINNYEIMKREFELYLELVLKSPNGLYKIFSSNEDIYKKGFFKRSFLNWKDMGYCDSIFLDKDSKWVLYNSRQHKFLDEYKGDSILNIGACFIVKKGYDNYLLYDEKEVFFKGPFKSITKMYKETINFDAVPEKTLAGYYCEKNDEIEAYDLFGDFKFSYPKSEFDKYYKKEENLYKYKDNKSKHTIRQKVIEIFKRKK